MVHQKTLQHAVTLLGYIFLLACVTSASTNTTQATKPVSWKVVEHKTLLVPCNITQSDDLEIYWTKNVTNGDFYQAGSNLMFTDILRKDSGDYVCHVFNTSLPGDNETNSNVTVEVINVDVQYPADITEFSLGPTAITENETFSVTVDVQGNPGPNWEIRNNKTGIAVLQVTGIAARSTLSANHVVCGDTGFWECTAFNELNNGVNVTRGANLTVLCPPRPDIRIPYLQQIKARVGDSTFFRIDVVGYPYPSYHWSRDDGKPIPDWIQTNYPEFSTLNITDIAVEDFGSYTLTITNDVGTYSAPMELKAYGSPMRAYDLTYRDVTYNSVTLSWRSGFDMGSEEHFVVMRLIGNEFIQISDVIYEKYSNNGIGHYWTYTLSNLHINTNYNLTVMAENRDGFMSGFTEQTVTFRTHFYPNPDSNTGDLVAERNTRILIGSVVGGLAFLAVLAFLVYMVKYRNMRTSYVDLAGGVKKKELYSGENEQSHLPHSEKSYLQQNV